MTAAMWCFTLSRFNQIWLEQPKEPFTDILFVSDALRFPWRYTIIVETLIVISIIVTRIGHIAFVMVLCVHFGSCCRNAWSCIPVVSCICDPSPRHPGWDCRCLSAQPVPVHNRTETWNRWYKVILTAGFGWYWNRLKFTTFCCLSSVTVP